MIYKTLVLAGAISLHAFSPAFTQSAPSYRVEPGATVMVDEHSVCRMVTNSGNAPIMVPTRTASEWTVGTGSFLQNLLSMSQVNVKVCPPINLVATDNLGFECWNHHGVGGNVIGNTVHIAYMPFPASANQTIACTSKLSPFAAPRDHFNMIGDHIPYLVTDFTFQDQAEVRAYYESLSVTPVEAADWIKTKYGIENIGFCQVNGVSAYPMTQMVVNGNTQSYYDPSYWQILGNFGKTMPQVRAAIADGSMTITYPAGADGCLLMTQERDTITPSNQCGWDWNCNYEASNIYVYEVFRRGG